MKKNILEELRIKQHMSRETLSELTGVSVEMLESIESQRETLVPIRSVLKISNAFGLKPSEIFLS